MATDFTDRRHANPDYELEVDITGVRLGNTGKVNWQIHVTEDIDRTVVAEIFERAALVLRGENEIDVRSSGGMLYKALIQWMTDHGDRCRICMEPSQEAVKAWLSTTT